MADEVKTCSICGVEYKGWGNNAQPINDGRCCDECNHAAVVPARIALTVEYDQKRRGKEK